MIEFVEYSDEKICIKLPKQLRQQRSMRFFRGNIVRGKPESQVMVAIDINFDARRVEAVKKIFIDSVEKQPVGQPEGYKVLRSGKCSFGDGGLEIFTSSEIFDKGYTLYSWDVLYQLQGHYIMCAITGGCLCEDFESMAKEIIMSLILLSPSQSKKASGNARGSKIEAVKTGGLQKKERERLAKALKSLPEKLKYLRGPIIAIADEDQDLLGCGEIDTELLTEAIEQQAVLHPPGFAAIQAKELEEWLNNNSSKNDKWAGPIWFTTAFIRGYDMFAGDNETGLDTV